VVREDRDCDCDRQYLMVIFGFFTHKFCYVVVMVRKKVRELANLIWSGEWSPCVVRVKKVTIFRDTPQNSCQHIGKLCTCLCRSPIKCGTVIRLTHLTTNRNLHSHHFQSPLSRNLEVSAFGDNGEGDEGTMSSFQLVPLLLYYL